MRGLTRIFVGLILALLSPLEGFQKAKLSQSQIEQLVTIGTPDEVIAQEIRDRGLAFAPTQKTVHDLEPRGAGQQTLAALRQLIRLGTLEVRARQGSEVSVDGVSRGSVGTEGALVLQELPIGSHEVLVRKSGYRESQHTVEIGDHEYKRLPVELEWAGGFLSLRVDPPTSTVVIEGMGSFNGGVAEFPCLPGTYSVTAKHAGLKSEIRTIVITPGQHAVAEFRLSPDAELLRERLNAADGQLAANDTRSAIQSANEVLTIEPNNLRARGIVAASYFRAQDLQKFLASSSETIRRGGSVAMTLLHVHTFPKKYLHPVTLTVSANSIAYDPQPSNGSCKSRAFVAPLKKVQGVEAGHNEGGEVLLLLKLIDPNSSSKVIAKVTTFDFAALGSHVVAPPGVVFSIGGGAYRIESPSNAREILAAAADLVRLHFKDRN